MKHLQKLLGFIKMGQV